MQSENTYPLLLDGKRTGTADNCSNWPESQEYYVWSKDKQPRIILAIPHGWCAKYVTLACCRNTAERIYPPLAVNVAVYNALAAEPQSVNSTAVLGETESLPRVDLDRCRTERYLEVQVVDPPNINTEMYHFISEVEVYGQQGTLILHSPSQHTCGGVNNANDPVRCLVASISDARITTKGHDACKGYLRDWRSCQQRSSLAHSESSRPMLSALSHVCRMSLSFTGFNVCSFCRLAAIHESFVHKNVDISGYLRGVIDSQANT